MKIGNEVDVRFSIFANTPQLVVPGRLNSLSNDLISDAPGVARNPLIPSEYYLARVDIDSDEALHVLNKRTVVAGMPAEIVIKTGERSLLRYLMRPLTKRIASALKRNDNASWKVRRVGSYWLVYVQFRAPSPGSRCF